MDRQRFTAEKQGIVERLNDFLGDGERALTTENFGQLRPIVDTLFPAVLALGIDLGSLQNDYQLELIQSGGQPSEGRLGYIKGHLHNLLEKVEAYDP